MRRLLVLILLLFTAACGSTESVAVQETPEGMSMLSEQSLDDVGHRDRFLGNLRNSWSQHLRDCRTGLNFTYRSMARETERNIGRMAWYFD
jgi:hypothetical protein